MEDVLETQPPAPGSELPDGLPRTEPAKPPASSSAPSRTDAEATSKAGRVARARRSAAELERRARREFDYAKEQHPTVRLAVRAFESDRRRAGGLLAGGLAYRIFLWQIPLALFLVSALGLATELSGDDPADLARKTGMTAALAGAISQAVAASDSARWWLLTLGAFLTVWAGRGVYRGVRLVSELAWDTRTPSGSALRGSLAVTGFGLLAIALQAFMPKIGQTLSLPALVRFVLGLILATSLAFAVLRLLPRADAPWTSVVPGAVLIGVGMRLLGLGVSTYFAYRLDHSDDLYGALGFAAVMMLFLFLVARLFVAAQFLNATLHARREPPPSAGAR
ncbi:MAG TPA: YhjD/YihY/BrkB family envelope integrity protein [Actinomycetota bacterium]|nr:YhjD/YihY/BrkB family envelope integrity protein [Actinomycetota bacterium]